MSEQPELMYDARAELGEGPVWDHRRNCLYWVDIVGHQVHIFDPATNQDRSINVDREVGCLAPRSSGGLILGLQDGFANLDPESEKITHIVDPEKHLPDNRFNDGKCDPQGRFWAGTMSKNKKKGAGSLYCLFPDYSFWTMLTGVTISNGLAWSLDHRTLYYIDTPTRIVSAFDYDPESGTISNRRRIISIPATLGLPDGMTIDEKGMLWMAQFGAGCITRWDPEQGDLLRIVEVPAPQVTSCTFGGTQLDELYITTARRGLDQGTLNTYPHSGGLFCVKPGVGGIRETAFEG